MAGGGKLDQARRKVGGGGAGRVDRARGPIETDSELEALWRGLDYYSTPCWAARAVGELVQQLDPGPHWAWEPACGAGSFAHGLADYFPRVFATDVHDHGGELQCGGPLDFLSAEADGFEADWILTNPPFEHAQAFVERGLKRARRGVAVLIRTTWLDTLGRYPLFADGRCGLAWLAPFAERVPMQLGPWDPDGSTATPAAVFVFLTPQARAFARIPHLVMSGAAAFAGQVIPPGTRDRLTKFDDAARYGRRGEA